METVQSVKNRMKVRKVSGSSLSFNKTTNEITKQPMFVKFMYQCMYSILLFFIVSVIVTQSTELESVVYTQVYKTNYDFASTNNSIKDMFGSIFIMDGLEEKIIPVGDFNVSGNQFEENNGGIYMNVSKNDIIQSYQTGIVVFIGEDKRFGEVVIIQQGNGVDMIYGNVDNIEVSLYDYVEKGQTIGLASSNKLLVAYEKNGEILDYNEYLPQN